MNPARHAANCRWGRLTLFESFPIWLQTENRPWSCARWGRPLPLADTDICRTCPAWEPLGSAPVRGIDVPSLRHFIDRAPGARETVGPCVRDELVFP